MEQAHKLMGQAVADNVFPGAVLLVTKEEAPLFFEAYGKANIFSNVDIEHDTVFDLASLTKPLATTLAIMKLFQEGKCDLTTNLSSVLPQFQKTGKEHITIRHLLCHNSGLPDYKPYFKSLSHLPVKERKSALEELLIKEPLVSQTGERTLYSDIGFMILKWVVESVSGMRFDRFVLQEIYQPLGLMRLFFVDLERAEGSAITPRVKFAATERCKWRKIILEGKVHDDNAYSVGGIAGHAGLFGTAGDINRLLNKLLLTYHGTLPGSLFRRETLQLFFRKQEDSDRSLGFDFPSQSHSSCGDYFSEKSVGHLGFTGTSFWMDLEKNIIVILLTNRVHPSRDNERIKKFRPEIHNAIMKNI